MPLKRKFFDCFEEGSKDTEYRPFGPRWNFDTCAIGRPVVLSCGYGKKRRLSGVVARVRRDENAVTLPGWRECYGDRFDAVCCITVANIRPLPNGDSAPSPLACQTGDMRAEMNCPNKKLAGSDWGSDSYKCTVCGKSYKTYDSEMQ